jgi:hypothetical protein
VVIRAIEKLNLLKGAGARKTASHSWMQAQEEVNSCGTCLLGSHNEELGKPITGFLLGPDIFVPLIITGILPKGASLLREKFEVLLCERDGRKGL